MKIARVNYSIRIWLKLILAISVFGCSINDETDKRLHSEIPSLNGSGEVYRSTFTYEFLNTAKTDTIVDFQHYAVPEQAAFPTNTLQGRLRFGDLGRRGINIAKIGHFLLSGGMINGEEILDSKMLSDVMNASASSVLSTSWDALKYSKGFWLLDLSENPSFRNCLESESGLIPYMSGYGGIRVFLLPNGTVYYYFSDNFEFAGLEGVTESNKIRSFCN